ncbi:NAD(P)/FAD-dependent oxidoreductase [Rhodovulum sp. FJ3]|uniref:NAD(P)/FAD-dependent oxidoreductase n=1 Tax=Rhodovulum sp. FJ3 TaxID=3079053 RepID=UPI00293DEF78|nr:NAD(P)/FAD-dependent oxidoreductase [Rhodovulum sp. FJ3]MDV4166578.1 NAD(P)/FAD-dependent oxidoreductase [Rhodovulum sp. FJ3]
MAARPYDCVILGAGAAGLMCAIHAGATGKRVLVLDHARAAGEKIRISGGGRCNFTNLDVTAANFISQNPHFAKSALARYTQWDFIDLLAQHNVTWHEKTLGQLFCDTSAKDIVRVLLDEVAHAGGEIRVKTGVAGVTKADSGFIVTLEDGRAIPATQLVIATGGKSIPKMGATGFGYQIAEQFGHGIVDPRPALVPLTFGDTFAPLAGTALPARVTCNGTTFDESILFTHRGLSGPAILQISSYWREGDAISVNLIPDGTGYDTLRTRRASDGRKAIGTVLGDLLPGRLAAYWTEQNGLSGNLADWSDKRLTELTDQIAAWSLTPSGSEGYRTAEVTLGGVDTATLSSKDMSSTLIPNLYFIGEVVDVTGWLGGYNFQWAWSSGAAAGRAIAAA